MNAMEPSTVGDFSSVLQQISNVQKANLIFAPYIKINVDATDASPIGNLRALYIKLFPGYDFESLADLLTQVGKDLKTIVVEYHNPFKYAFCQPSFFNPEIRNVKRLVLSQCNLEPRYYPSLWTLQNLQHLEIIGCPKFGVEAAAGILRTNIESLELSELAKMPHVTGQVLQTLAQMDLQYLRLASGKCKDEKMLYDELLSSEDDHFNMIDPENLNQVPGIQTLTRNDIVVLLRGLLNKPTKKVDLSRLCLMDATPTQLDALSWIINQAVANQ